MNAAQALARGGKSGPTGLPVMSLEQVEEVRSLLRQHDEADAHLARCREALQAWAGAGQDGGHLGALLSAALPDAVAGGMAAQDRAQALERDLGGQLSSRVAERQGLLDRLGLLQERRRKVQADAEARLQALERVQPLAEEILAAGASLALLLARQAEQRGRRLAGLWGALSGQAAALQRELDEGRRAQAALQASYHLRVTSLGLFPEPRPEQLCTLLQTVRRERDEGRQQADREEEALRGQLAALDRWIGDAQARLNGGRVQAAARWREAQRLHGVPAWPVWERLWPRREDAQRLWRAGEEAGRRRREAILSLQGVWSGWPAEWQDVGVLRQGWPQLEQAAEAARRTEERTQRTALLLSLQQRLGTERRRTEEAREAEAAAHQQASQARAAVLPAAPPPRQQAQAAWGGRPLPDAAQRRSEPSPALPVLAPAHLEPARALLARHAGAAAQAAMCQEALEEWAGPGLNGPRLAALVSRPLPPALAQALTDWQTVCQAPPPSLSGLQRDDHDRRVLGWEMAWTELRRTLGVPADPGDWHRLWASRDKAQAFWRQWRQAQQRLEELEAEMAPLWAGWPSPQQTAAALRRAFEAAAGAGPAAPPTPPAVPAPPLPGEGGRATVRRTPTVEPRPTSSALRPPLPGQAAASWRPHDAGPAPVLPRSGPGEGDPLAAEGRRSVATAAGAPASTGSPFLLPAQATSSSPSAPTAVQEPRLVAGGGKPPAGPVPQALQGPPPSLVLLTPGAPAMPGVPASLRAAQQASVPPPSPVLPPLPRPRPTPVSSPPEGRVPGPALPGQARPPGAPLPESRTPPGRLTHRQRAEREAVRISEQYNWKRGFLALADALDRDKWGQLRASIEREIAHGMTPEEFELMLQLRAYWHEQLHFQSPYTSRYDSLPWGLGLALIRRSAGVPCLDEMIILLDRLYEYAEGACSKRALPAFAQRLGAILDRADPDVDLEYWLCAQEARCSFR